MNLQPEPNDSTLTALPTSLASLDDGQLFAIFGAPDESDPEAMLGLARLRKRLFGVEDAEPRIGEYLLKEVIGHGGMGKVYRAYSPSLDRDCALKVILVAGDDAAAHERLLAEARAMAKLSHPNVVTVHGVGVTDDKRPYLVMELVHGVNLRRWQRQYADDWKMVLARYVEAGRGLHAIHHQRLIHGDVKPDNILVQVSGEREFVAKVADFGLARNLQGEQVLPDGRHVSYGGTPEYAAPEQLLDGRCDARSDQYSFCVALFESLNGTHPYARTYDELRSTLEADSAETTRLRHILELQEGARSGEVRWSARGRRLPSWLKRALVRGLQRDPGARFSSMAALVDAIDPAKRRTSRILIASAVCAGMAVTAGGTAVYMRERALAPCQLGAEVIGSVWSDEARAAIEPRYPEAAPALDRYSSQWAEAYRSICTQGTIDESIPEPVMKVRRSCLDARQAEVAAAVSLLAGPGPLPVPAAEVLQAIRPVSLCQTQFDALEPPLPAEEEEVQAIHGSIAEAYMREVVQDFDRAQTISEAALSRAQATEYAPVIAEAMYQRGRVAIQDSLRRARDRAPFETGLADVQGAVLQAMIAGHRQVAIDGALFALKSLERAATAGLGAPPVMPAGLDHIRRNETALTPDQRGELALYMGMRDFRRGMAGEEVSASLQSASKWWVQAAEEFAGDGNTVDEARARRNAGDACLALAERVEERAEERARFLECAVREFTLARERWGRIEASERRKVNHVIVGARLLSALRLRKDEAGVAAH